MIQYENKIALGTILHGLFQASIVIVALTTGFLTGRDRLHDLEVEVANQKQTVNTLQNRFENLQVNMNGGLNKLQDLLTALQLDESRRGQGARK